MDDGDSKKSNIFKRVIANASDVLPTVWLRLPIQADNGGKWIILDGRRYILWNVRFFLALLYFAIQALKNSA